jgi:hypothetical protein
MFTLRARALACFVCAGHDAEVRAFELQFDASAQQLHANFQYNLNTQARARACTRACNAPEP